MKQKLKSLQFRILLPAFIIIVFVVTLMNTLYSRAYIRMILQQEQKVNEVGFETVSHTITPLIETSISNVRNILTDERVASYAGTPAASMAEQVKARIRCRDYLRGEISRSEGIYGLFIMRTDESVFGVVPDANFFLDDPKDNPFPEDVKARILNAPLGQTVWVGPFSGKALYGFETANTSQNIMIAAWKTMHVSYGEAYALMVIDGSAFGDLFETLQDGKSTWHLFTEDLKEISHTGEHVCLEPEQLIHESNSGEIFYDEEGHAVCAFSMTMDFPAWTLVREVSMENYERLVFSVNTTSMIFGGVLTLIVLGIYTLWLRRFMRQFRSLQSGIVQTGEGDLEPAVFEPTSIGEFQQMQKEINRTRLALSGQMDTIRRMEREQMEQENERKEQERIARELTMAREIQENALPRTFPAFPDRTEFDLFASMTPAKEVGGDFYDFFLIDSDHLALVIADVSGKGIPAALFMMTSKALIRTELMARRDPAAALEAVNLQLCERNSSAMFVTVWLAVVEVSTGKGLACNAGHENPVTRRTGETYRMLEYPHNMFVGARKKSVYQNREFELQPGDSVLVYTDGVPEATDAAEEMFGEERLMDTLNQHPDAGPEAVIRNVHEAVNRFAGDAPQFDDITLLCFQYNGKKRKDVADPGKEIK